MFSHVKSLIWLVFAVSSFLAAALYTLEIAVEQNESYDALAARMHGAERSVYGHEGDADFLDFASETYTGLEILHRLPDWNELGMEIEVSGELLNAPPSAPLEDVLEQSRKRALAVLDLRADYVAERVYDVSGKEIRVIFRRK